MAITEAPCDALSLAVLGVSALSTQGTSWPTWLPKALAFKNVRLAHDNDEPDHLGRRAGDEAAAKLAPELGRWGATVERWRPEGAKDWNGILQHGIDVMRLAIAADGESQDVEQTSDALDITARVPNPGPQPEDDDDEAEELPPAAVVRGAPKQPAVPYAVVAQPDQCEVDELLAWFTAAPRPAAPFQLWPWARVADVDRFYAALESDLKRGPKGQRWLPAVEELRQLARLFGSSAEVAARHRGEAA